MSLGIGEESLLIIMMMMMTTLLLRNDDKTWLKQTSSFRFSFCIELE